MKIERKKNNLVVTIPLFQESFDAIGEHTHNTNNLVGVIAKDEYTISQLIDLGYKGTQDEGMPIICFNTREALESACTIAGIDIWEHPICKKCDKVIYGSHSWDNGAICVDCTN